MLTRLLMISVLACASTSDENLALQPDAPLARFGCSQPAREQAAIIREAEANHYSIRRLEFLGNESMSDPAMGMVV